jgi:hypothetical protein
MAIAGVAEAEIGKQASENASSAEQQREQEAIQYEQSMYGQTAANMQPFINTGTQATQQLANGMGPGGSLGRQFTMADFEKSPSYNFNMQQALKAIGNSASARGGSLGGRPQQDMVNYATNMAGNSFGQAQNEFMANQKLNAGLLGGIAQTGQRAAQSLGGIGMGTAGQVSSSIGNQATAQGAGIMGQSQAVQGGISNIANGLTAAYQNQTPATFTPNSALMAQVPFQQQNPYSVGNLYQTPSALLNTQVGS